MKKCVKTLDFYTLMGYNISIENKTAGKTAEVFMRKTLVGSHIRTREDLEKLIIFIARNLNHKSIRYTTEHNKEYDYYNLFFWITTEELKTIEMEYQKTI